LGRAWYPVSKGCGFESVKKSLVWLVLYAGDNRGKTAALAPEGLIGYMEKRKKKMVSGAVTEARSMRGHKQLAKAVSLAKKSSGSRLTVEQLANKTCLSSRHLARLFSKEMQMRPAQFLEHLRVRAAIHRLEETTDSVAQIAKDCGFGSRASLYRAFDRVVHTSPAEYRAQHSKRKNEGRAGTGESLGELPSIEEEDCGKVAV